MSIYCPICLTDVELYTTLDCNHMFCNTCIISLIYHHAFKKCAICRTNIDLTKITPIEIPENIELNESPSVNVIINQSSVTYQYNDLEQPETIILTNENNTMNNEILETYTSTVRINQTNQYGILRQHIVSIENPLVQNNEEPEQQLLVQENNRRNIIPINNNDIINCFMSLILSSFIIFIFCIFFI